MCSVFVLQYLTGKDNTGNAEEHGRILLKISLQFVARYDVNWTYLYSERIQLLSQLDHCGGRTKENKALEICNASASTSLFMVVFYN